MRFLILWLASVPLCWTACLPITTDRIYGRDLALAEPALAALPSDLSAGFAPAPGGKRSFSSADLTRIARGNGISAANLSEICFVIPEHAPVEETVLRSMTSVLPGGAAVRIVDLPGTPVPDGVFEFAASGLQAERPGSEGLRIWRGSVRYAGTRRLPFAVLVRLTRAAPAVHRGDTLRVEIRSGFAQLHLDAVAQSDGWVGDTVFLKNPSSGRAFKARVEAGPRVVLEVGSRSGL